MNIRMDKTIETFNKIAPSYAKFTFEKIQQYELNKFISLFNKKSKILDVGCGSGRDVQYFIEYGLDPVGIDLSDSMLKEATTRVKDGNILKMDMKNLKFKENNFDGIWCCVTLSHIKKKELLTILKEFKRVLKQKGYLYISVKKGDKEGFETDEKYNNLPLYLAYYSKEEIENLLKKAGFTIYSSYLVGNKVEWINVFAKNP